MPIRRIPSVVDGFDRRVAIVLSRFNPEIGEKLLVGALRALSEAKVNDEDIVIATVPGALETPLALHRLADSGEFDALIALGAVVRGETYHFQIVATESARGVSSVSLEFGVPIGNGILTTDTEAQAIERAERKGFEAANAALELTSLLDAIDEE